MKPALFFLFTLLISVSASAGISKCKKPDGSFYFSDSGCQGQELIGKKEIKPNVSTSRSQSYGQGISSGTSCTSEDRRQADEHFTNANKILGKRAHGYDQEKDKKRWYEHEMMVGKIILAACKGNSSCTNTDKSNARVHFMRAKEINESKAHGYDQRKDRSRRYNHEMSMARNILSSCSSEYIPGSTTVTCKTKADLHGITQYGNTTGQIYGKTTCREQ